MQFQLDLSGNSNSSQSEQHRLPLKDGQVRFFPHWLSQAESDRYFERLCEELEWRQDSIKLFGKLVKIPRLQAWYGDRHCLYAYSGLTLNPRPWTPSLMAIKTDVERTLQHPFNCVLGNWYRDGQDSMSMHCDDEPELGPDPTIASVSLGATRNFDIKHKRESEKHRVELKHGSLLVMEGQTQQHYLHGIAKSKRIHEGRINLTFRYIATHLTQR